MDLPNQPGIVTRLIVNEPPRYSMADLSRHEDRGALAATLAAPGRIYATVNGTMFSFPGSIPYRTGGWDEHRRRDHAVEYVRADLVQAALGELADIRAFLSVEGIAPERVAKIDAVLGKAGA